jgi:short subunit dehydrogenase-like uncharacterized protein
MVIISGGDEYSPFTSKFYSKEALAEYLGDSVNENEPVLEYLFEKYNRATPRDDRRYDIIFYGVTGYTGKLVLEYLRDVYAKKPTEFTFALGGRTESKVAAAQDAILKGTPFADAPIVTAQLDKPYTVKQLVNSCRTVVNLAGPFMTTGGEVLAEACVIYECDYCDVNGELPYTYNLTRLHDRARHNRVRLVPNSAFAGGFADIAAFAAVRKLKEKHNKPARSCTGYIEQSISELAGPSGGTLATRAAMANAPDSVKQIMADPFGLGGRVSGNRPEDSDKTLSTVAKDEVGWLAPFNYAFLDTRVVRRANVMHQLMGGGLYGPVFNHQEYILCPTEEIAQEIKKRAGSTKKEEEDLKAKGRYFAQGQGPSMEEMKGSWIRYTTVARTEDKEQVKLVFNFDVEAYYATAQITTEVAICLAMARDQLPYAGKGGVLSPSVACGQMLVDRLLANGMSVSVE